MITEKGMRDTPQWVQKFYDEWGFYPMAGGAMGAAGFLGLAKETTWGSAVGASDYVELLSESMDLTIDRFEIKNIAAIYTEPDDMSGLRRIEGNVEFPVFPEVLGHFLRGVFGNPSSVNVVASGYLHNNIFRTPTADFASGQPVPGYTFEVFRDVTSSFQFAGVVMNTLQLSVQPNQELRCSVGVIGKSTSVINKTSPSFVSSPVEPFAFDTCSISIAGAGTALIESFTLDIDGQIQGIPALNASTSIAKIRRGGPQMVGISGTIDFDNLTEYNNFLNQTEQAFVLNFTKSNSFNLKISLPRVVYTAFPIAMGGRDRITANFTGKCRYHTGSATAVEFQLTTTSSGF